MSFAVEPPNWLTWIKTNWLKVYAAALTLILVGALIVGCTSTSAKTAPANAEVVSTKVEAALDSAKKTKQQIGVARDILVKDGEFTDAIDALTYASNFANDTVTLLDEADKEAKTAVVSTRKLAKSEAKIKEDLEQERSSFFSHQQRLVFYAVAVVITLCVVVYIVFGSKLGGLGFLGGFFKLFNRKRV